MQMLARRFSLISLHELCTQLEAGSLKPRQACVTFDDGYADNYEHAFPILRRAGIPATIFLVTGSIEDGKAFWWERLGALLAERSRQKRPPAPPRGPHRVLTSPEAAASVYDRLVRKLQTLESGGARDHYLETLGAGPAKHARPLSWDAVMTMQHAGINFGSHSHTHPSLSDLADAAVRDEIATSRHILVTHLHRPPALFAYPFGNTGPQVCRAVKAVGFVAAATTEQARCSAASDPYLLPRLHVRNWDGEQFTSVLDKAMNRGFSNKCASVLKRVLPPALRTLRRLRGAR